MNTFKLYLIGALIGAAFAIVGWAYIAGGNDERAKTTVNDQRGAITVHETANEVLRRADGVSDPDELLRGTNGLRDDQVDPE